MILIIYDVRVKHRIFASSTVVVPNICVQPLYLQVNLDKHPAEMAISPEIFAALKETTPERLQILTHMFSALGMDVSQGEPLSTTPCILFAVSQVDSKGAQTIGRSMKCVVQSYYCKNNLITTLFQQSTRGKITIHSLSSTVIEQT